MSAPTIPATFRLVLRGKIRRGDRISADGKRWFDCEETIGQKISDNDLFYFIRRKPAPKPKPSPAAGEVVVALSEQDWTDLNNFITGDLHNMEESPLKDQLRRIQDTILRAIVSPAAHRPPWRKQP